MSLAKDGKYTRMVQQRTDPRPRFKVGKDFITNCKTKFVICKGESATYELSVKHELIHDRYLKSELVQM